MIHKIPKTTFYSSLYSNTSVSFNNYIQQNISFIYSVFSFSQIITSSKFKTGVVLSALEIHTCRESERMHKISGFPKSAVANQWVGLNIDESAMKCCH